MADNKHSFLLYTDLIHTVSKLADDQAGILFKHILRYVNDENPETDNILIQVAFEPIKQQLKRDLRKYEGIVKSRKLAGLASAEKRKQKQQVSTRVNKCQQTPTKPTDNDNDTVNVNDNVIVKYNKIPPTLDEVKVRISERGLSVDAERFMAHYISNGWKVSGRAAMKDWDAALTTWEKNNKKFDNNGSNRKDYQRQLKHPNEQW